MTIEQQATQKKAAETISAIDFLLKRDEFIAFREKHFRRIAEMEQAILGDEMTPEQRERLRQRRLGMLEVLNSPEEDREMNRRILSHSRTN
jgi:hypothetical protein